MADDRVEALESLSLIAILPGMLRISTCALFFAGLAATACLVACGPAAIPSSANSQPSSQQAADEQASSSDTNGTAGSDDSIPRWVMTSIVNAGYRCNEDSPTLCMTEDDDWVVSVATRVESNQALIMLDSFAARTPQSACHAFKVEMQSLRSEPHLFSVSCNDSSAQFRMNTTLVYSQELDVTAWMEQHRKSRYDAWQKLSSASALGQ